MYILERVQVNLDGRSSMALYVSINPKYLWQKAYEYNGLRDWKFVDVDKDGFGYKTAEEDDYGGVYYYVDYITEV